MGMQNPISHSNYITEHPSVEKLSSINLHILEKKLELRTRQQNGNTE